MNSSSTTIDSVADEFHDYLDRESWQFRETLVLFSHLQQSIDQHADFIEI